MSVPSGSKLLKIVRRAPQGEGPPSGMSSPAGTLFTYGFDAGPRPTSFVVSILVHSIAGAIICFGIGYKPRIVKMDTAHYTERELDLITPDLETQPSKAGIAYPSVQETKPKPSSGGKPSPLRQPVLRLMTQAKPGPQTLIQPDLPAQVTLADEIPVPQIVIWTPSKAPVKNIVPPLPQKPTAADVKPTVDMPNQEVNLADIRIASSDRPSTRNIDLASTTSPITIEQPKQVQLPPVSATQKAAQPTPATILSLSDMRMKEGTTVLPPANESAASNSEGALASGRAQDSSPQGSDNPAAKPAQTSSGSGATQGQTGSGPATDKANGSGPAKSNAPASGSASSPVSGSAVASSKPETSAPAQGGNLPSESSGQPSLTQIKLPRDGRFSAVVVGNALEDRFPEIADVGKGRIAYTAYLHVGLAKSWIMQFFLPRDADASAGGTVARLDAPWPYDIVRPNLEPGSIDADALMIHGFIDPSGRFQGLSVAFPPAFPQAQFVLEALEKWQFRAAMQDGQPIRVEMLLIIPDIED